MNTEDNNDFRIEGLPKENPFKVPEGYFDRFPSRLAERMEEEKKIIRFPFASFLRPAPMVAAAAMLITVGIFGYKMLTGPADPLTDEEISTYVYQEGIIDEFELDELIENTDMADIELNDSTLTPDQSNPSQRMSDDELDASELIDEL